MGKKLECRCCGSSDCFVRTGHVRRTGDDLVLVMVCNFCDYTAEAVYTLSEVRERKDK